MGKFYLNDVVKTKGGTITYITSVDRKRIINLGINNISDVEEYVTAYKLFACDGLFNENELELVYKTEDELKLDEILENWIGKEFYSNVYGKCKLAMIHIINKTLRFTTENDEDFIVRSDGRMSKNGNIVIFPNEQIYKNYPTDYKCKVQWLKWYVTNSDTTYNAVRFFMEDSKLSKSNIKKLIKLIDKYDKEKVINCLTIFAR